MEDDQRKAGRTGREEYEQINRQRVADFVTQHGRKPLPHEILLFQEVNWNGGHLVGTATDGPGEIINVVAMLESLNQAQSGTTPAQNYRKFEDAFIELLKTNDPPQVKLVIELDFPGNQETPEVIVVTYVIDNKFTGSYRYNNVPPYK
ncbi:DNA/RNA non-specific endonuclease [Actinomadura sp. CNU-125]|uniref:DNA/RNA non-specific endonuclease n=1 Tax=Actinomadura sp. CNU-125 TaxID=1904961 RepID=UPI0021CCE559|nr:DNA/RNA non-specific endonuclease [Actinomadura sp. CNU-125]